jgi:hypothetical protein
MKVGVKVLISVEAAADWRREREQAAAEATKAERLRVSSPLEPTDAMVSTETKKV